MKNAPWSRIEAACAALLLAGCAAAEPHPGPAAAPSSTVPPATAPRPVSPAAPIVPAAGAPEPDSPAGFTTRVIAALPAPDARAAREDLPAGATCRIGSDRLRPSRDYGEVVFPSADRVLLEGLGRWITHDALSGAQVQEIELGVVTSGVSPSGACVAALAADDAVELFRMPARQAVTKRKFPEDDHDDVVPADDCSAAAQWPRYGQPCVKLFGGSLEPTGEVCAGIEVRRAALSGDGRRVALVPDRMSEHDHRGDGVHVFDTRSREEVFVARRKGKHLGDVALSRDGGLLAMVDGDEVRAVAVPAGNTLSTFVLPADTVVRGLVLSPAAKRLAVSLDRSKPTREAGLAVLDVATGKALFIQWGLPAVGHIAFSPDGTRVAYAAKSGVRIVDTFTGEDLVAGGRLFQVESAALSPAGDRAVVSSAGHLTVWDTRDCGRVADLPNQPQLEDLVILPGNGAAVGFAGEEVVRIDLATGARTGVDLGTLHARDSQAVSPDGRTAVVGMEDEKRKQRIVFVDLAIMKVLRRVTIPGVGPIGALIFTPDGKKVHAAAPGGLAHGDSPLGDTSVVEVDAATGALGRRFQLPGASQSYLGVVLEKGRVIVVNDDWRERATGKELPRVKRTLMAVSGDHRTALWSTENGAFAWPVEDPLPASAAASPSPYGRPAVGREAILHCGEQSCIVTRVGGGSTSSSVRGP